MPTLVLCRYCTVTLEYQNMMCNLFTWLGYQRFHKVRGKILQISLEIQINYITYTPQVTNPPFKNFTFSDAAV